MTPFRALLTASNLSVAEAAEYCAVSFDTAKSWYYGRRASPGSVINELRDLINRQEHAAQQAITVIHQQIAQHGVPGELTIGYCAGDDEARKAPLGWPCKSAHDAVIARVLAALPDNLLHRVVLVPRGSTPATAAAVDAHEA